MFSGFTVNVFFHCTPLSEASRARIQGYDFRGYSRQACDHKPRWQMLGQAAIRMTAKSIGHLEPVRPNQLLSTIALDGLRPPHGHNIHAVQPQWPHRNVLEAVPDES
jgi:hypothetical protein